MAFAQLTYRESLRDFEAYLRAQQSKLYHMGIRSRVSRSTLADANERRDWRIYADFAQSLIHTARRLYLDEDFGIELSQTVYALDATTIDLRLSVFPWAPFRRTKAAIKLHNLLDLRGSIPAFIHVSDGKLHDVNVLDLLVPEPGAFYIMDRAYLDFTRLYLLGQCGAFFVTRARSNITFRRRYSHPVDKSTGLRCDQTIVLKSFYGTSENAVKTQIWIAVSVYVLVAIVKKRLGLEISLYTILQILSVTAFEKMPLSQAITDSDYRLEPLESRNQLKLFD